MGLDSHTYDVKVTVGICVRNSEATVREAIESVLGQNSPHKSMELVIVDSYSRDNTLGIVKDCLRKTDIRSKIFYENEGLGLARQIVVDNADGDYIVWVDGDMVLSKDFIRKQTQFMEQNQRVGIAKGKYGDYKKSDSKNMVATLENVDFILDTTSEGETGSKSLGTSGCIYRVDAIKQVGGFDLDIRGVGEDMDAENRIREAGWSIYVTSALFYETRRKTWSSLWNEYFWHGKGGHRLFRKNRRLLGLYKMVPPVALAVEFFRVPAAYRLTRRKIVLFLPWHYAFKRIAWFFGFVSGWLQKGDQPGST